MGQLYMQKFDNRGGIDKGEFDALWEVGLKAFRSTGNFGNVKDGIKTHGVYATTWGGYVLFEAATPEAFAEYQTYHYQNFGHQIKISFEPVVNMDAAFSA